MPQPVTGQSRFRRDIQGLRGIAVLAILLDHVGVTQLHGGFAGLDVFFVISGYLIIGHLTEEMERTQEFSVLNFYGRRARRILPAAFAVLVSVVIASRFLLNPIAFDNLKTEAGRTAGLALNFGQSALGADYFGQDQAASPLQHYWPLAVGAQFYLVIPLLALAILAASRYNATRSLARLKWLVAVITVASLAWSVISTAATPLAAYFSSLTRAWQLGAGGLLALVLATRPKWQTATGPILLGFLGICGLATTFLTFTGLSHPGYVALLPVGATLCILAAGHAECESIVQRALAVRPLALVGLISFSLYLWHWPVVVLTDAAVPQLANNQNVRQPVLVLTALALGALSYSLVERPAKHLSWQSLQQYYPWVTRYGPVTAMCAVAMFAVAAVLLPSTSIAPQQEQVSFSPPSSARANVISQSEAQWRKRLAASLDVATVPKDLQPPLTDVPKDHEDGRCLFMSDSNFQQCRIGSPTAKKTVALLGDEHALMWTTALRNILLPLGYAIQPLTMGGCPNARITVFDHALPNHGRECDKHRAWVFRKLAVMNPDTVVMSDFSGFADYTGPDGKRTTIGVRDAWATGLERTLAKIHPLTHHIVVLGQTPRGRALEKCLPSSLNLSRCYGDDVYLSGIRVMEKRIITDINGMYVDPGPWLCVAESCPPIIDKTPVYFDDNHFTVTLTKRLTPLLRTKLRPITHPVKLQHP